jgi:poly(3-hydroxybutyrate) depolymerase
MAALAFAASCGVASAQPIASGLGETVFSNGNEQIRILTYRPQCANPSLLIVFHGLHRNAESARKGAQKVADQLCMLVLAPLFDKERFPTWRYQRGGLIERRSVLPPAQWTVNWIPRIASWARQNEGRNMPVTLAGHSAGAQFLSRVAAYSSISAHRMIVANPSTYVTASAETQAPFGFGGVFRNPDAELRAYLAKPVVIALGGEDTGEENLSTKREAMEQGENRLERGKNVFAAAERLARSRGWQFAWRLVIVEGVGHKARSMYTSPEIIELMRVNTGAARPAAATVGR